MNLNNNFFKKFENDFNKDVNLSNYSWFNLGGNAEYFFKPKDKNQLIELNVTGNVNVLNNKINFKKIIMNEDYMASKEDLNYYKQSFESILFNTDFIGIFDLDNIKDFILEISQIILAVSF